MVAGAGQPINVRRITRLTVLGVAIALGLSILRVAAAWISNWFDRIPLGWVRHATIAIMNRLLIAHGVLAVLALAAAVCGAAWYWVGRSHGSPRTQLGAARVSLLSVASLVALSLLEVSAALHERWIGPEPVPPHGIPVTNPATPPAPDADEIVIMVLGESSAEGQPYPTRFGIAQVVAWQLEAVFPGRRIRVDLEAYGGAPLQPMPALLAQTRRRPSAVLVYSGHNEFQARYAWNRTVPAFYVDDVGPRRDPPGSSLMNDGTPLRRLLETTIAHHQVSIPPPERITRELVDRPTCTTEEYAQILHAYERQLEWITATCERWETLPILVIPPANLAGCEPNRSFLAPATTRAERAAFDRDFRAARALEAADLAAAEAAFRALLERQPSFAETHFRLARLLARGGHYDEANAHYVAAKDLDGLPMRCPSDFQDVVRAVAARHHAVLIDAPATLRRIAPHGILDDHLFHDPHHPTFRGYLALAQEVLERLRERRAFGWPAAVSVPIIDPDQCATQFQFDRFTWAGVCRRSSGFHGGIAHIRHDATERLDAWNRYAQAATRAYAGEPPDQLGIAGLGVHPAGLRDAK